MKLNNLYLLGNKEGLKVITDDKGYITLWCKINFTCSIYFTPYLIPTSNLTYIDKLLEPLIDRLDESEKKVIQLRCGFNGGIPLSYNEVGKELKCSLQTARYKEIKAYRKIKEGFWQLNHIYLKRSQLYDNDLYSEALKVKIEKEKYNYLKDDRTETFYLKKHLANRPKEDWESDKMADSLKQHIKDSDLSLYGLSARTYNCLIRNEITTVKDLFKYGDDAEYLYRIKNLGKVGISEIYSKLPKKLQTSWEIFEDFADNGFTFDGILDTDENVLNFVRNYVESINLDSLFNVGFSLDLIINIFTNGYCSAEDMIKHKDELLSNSELQPFYSELSDFFEKIEDYSLVIPMNAKFEHFIRKNNITTIEELDEKIGNINDIKSKMNVKNEIVQWHEMTISKEKKVKFID